MAAKGKKKEKKGKKKAKGIVVTESAIMIALGPDERRKARRCLKRSGKITFAVKEHSVTHLPQLLDNGKLID
ncbi:MAG: hypothetical protein QNK04_32415 [Myxococcota bacterium]|nr:hypothetical protein [Myxococcota bacterium]